MGEFKVLIAGGSLVGLTLALALEQAGVEYELFEKGEFAPQLGASIGLHPHSLRILEQLGAWEDIEKEIVPLDLGYRFDSSGNCFERSTVLEDIRKVLGRPVVFLERSRTLEILYGHVKDKSRLHANSAIVGYEETEDGVVVTTQNGTIHHGHILVGADGVHSKVRQAMAEKIGESDAALSKEIAEGFTSQYKCLFAVSRNDGFLPVASVHNVFCDNHSALVAAGVPGLAFWFLFVKTALTTSPNSPRFTEADADTLAREYGGISPGPGYTVKDLWDARVKGSLVPMEEGVIKQWSRNRVVLVGDAIHKATVNPGLAGNLAFEGVAHLANGLISLLKEHPSPSLQQLNAVFDHFDQVHRPRAATVCDLSGTITRYEARDSLFLRFAARYLSRLMSDSFKAKMYAKFSNGAPWLDFLPLPAQDAELAEKKAKASTSMTTTLVVAAAVVGTAVLWQMYR